MKKLEFKRMYAKNFLPFGPEGIELFFQNFGNIVLVLGENLDVKPIDSEERLSSNGSGKSSLQEILIWTLYGKTVKTPKKIKADGVVHNIYKKNCVAEVEWDDYKISRGRKPGFLRLWKGEQELTLGEMKETQEKIEEIIGLNYEAFVNICVFADEEDSCFLECDSSTKRQIVENLLSLGVYREKFDSSKDALKEVKESIKNLSKEYDTLVGIRKESERRLELTKQKEKNWLEDKKKEIINFEKSIVNEKSKLNSSDYLQKLEVYEKAQISFVEKEKEKLELDANLIKLKDAIEEFKKKKNSLEDQIRDCKNEIFKVKQNHDKLSNDIKIYQKEINDLLLNVPGTKCGKCRETISEENISNAVEENKNKKVEIENELEVIVKDLNSRNEKLKDLESKLSSAQKKQIEGEAFVRNKEKIINTLFNEINSLKSIAKPQPNTEEAVIQQKIESLQESLENKKQEILKSPYEEIILNDKNEVDNSYVKCQTKEAEIKKNEADVPYYEYWNRAFGDDGIRRWVIDEIIPSLNDKIKYWLSFLIDNKICLKFDNELNETIERVPVDGDPYIYHAMSKGQRRRLNLSVSQAFAHVMSLSTATMPSIVFLDEVTTNIDPLGVIGIFNMIKELSEEKQVFITTHDSELLKMLQGCDLLKLRHENGITKVVQ